MDPKIVFNGPISRKEIAVKKQISMWRIEDTEKVTVDREIYVNDPQKHVSSMNDDGIAPYAFIPVQGSNGVELFARDSTNSVRFAGPYGDIADGSQIIDKTTTARIGKFEFKIIVPGGPTEEEKMERSPLKSLGDDIEDEEENRGLGMSF